jgi:hypothetical protein
VKDVAIELVLVVDDVEKGSTVAAAWAKEE